MSEKAWTRSFPAAWEFTKGAAVSAGAVSLQAASRKRQPGPASKWDEEADVIVVGYGGAGAVTAIDRR